MTPKRVTKILEVKIHMVHYLCRSGALKAKKLPGVATSKGKSRWDIDGASVERLKKARTAKKHCVKHQNRWYLKRDGFPNLKAAVAALEVEK